MSGVRLLVGTKKGAFMLTADGNRQRWEVNGPHPPLIAAGPDAPGVATPYRKATTKARLFIADCPGVWGGRNLKTGVQKT